MTTYERWYAPAGGTISVEAGATTIVGSAQCTFTNQAVAGDALLIRSGPNAGLLLQVAVTPTTDLQLVIDKPWPGVTQSGVEFAILPIATKRSMASDIHARVSALYASLLHPFKVTGQPSDDLGADGSIATDQAARQFWFKSGGTWGAPISMTGTAGAPGEVSAAQLAAAISGVLGGASASYDTLKKIEDKLAPILAGASSAYDTFAEINAYITGDQSAAAAISGVLGGASASYDTLKKIEDKLAPILAGASSAYDTFAEINAYITGDQSAAAAFNTALGNRLRFDGAQALTAEQKTQLLTNAGAAPAAAVAGTNLLVNGDFRINQRAFAFGALADGVYGVDRWKAVGASDLGWAGTTQTLTLNAGAIRQVVEPAAFGFVNLASQQVTVSVEGLTGGNLTVAVGSASGVITPGSGRSSVTLTLGAGDTGNINVTLTPANYPTAWRRTKLELGSAATDWQVRPLTQEFELCRRYFQRYGGVPSLGNFQTIMMGFFWNTSLAVFVHRMPVRMRATPTLSYPNASSIACGNASASSAVSSMALSGGVNNTPDAVEINATLDSAVGVGGNGCRLSGNNSAVGFFDLIAEL